MDVSACGSASAASVPIEHAALARAGDACCGERGTSGASEVADSSAEYRRRDRVPGGDAVERAQIRRFGASKARSGLAARALQLDAEVVLGDVHFREVDVAGGT